MGTQEPHQLTELVAAIRLGKTERVASILASDPGLALKKVEGRSLLHVATDWPANLRNVGDSIALLVKAGADVDAQFPHPDNPEVVRETPLHWAASSGDVAAIDALLDAGATVDPLGGIFGGCTPFEEAVIFDHIPAALRLQERGAAQYLPGVAALGRLDLVRSYFDENDHVRTDIGMLPHWTEAPPVQVLLDRAFQFACRSGHLEIAVFLRERGAKVDAETPANTTALDEAKKNGHTRIVEWLAGCGPLVVLSVFALALACGKTSSETETKPPIKDTQMAPEPLAKPPAQNATVPPAQTADPVPPGEGVVYDCPERPVPTGECATSPAWIAKLHHAAQHVQVEETPHHRPAPDENCDRANAMIAEGLKANPESLTWRERVVVQSAALTLAAGSRCVEKEPARKEAAQLASMMALAPSVLRPLGSKAGPELETWLGPRADWQDTKRAIPPADASVPDGSLRHNEAAFFLRSFRPIRTASTRAIFSQFVAIDTSGEAQVTPLVASIELRSGLDDTANACVVEIDLHRLRCDSGSLRPAVLSDFPEHSRGFVRRSKDVGRVLCTSCHGLGPSGATNGGKATAKKLAR
jgi:ankyrin repeat protein